jgi:hypothetical protein
MIVTKLHGGLGNQMFQYAIGRNLAEKNGTELVLDTTEYDYDKLRVYELHNLKIHGRVASEFKQGKLRKFVKKITNIVPIHRYKHLTEKNRYFDPTILENRGNLCLDGYWQCEEYFKEIKYMLVEDFALKDEPDEINNSIMESIRNSNAVCVHVRRGDYATDPKTNKFHGTCSLDYYNNAVRFIETKISDPTFFIFSDDAKWAKENLKITSKSVHVAVNGADQGHKDLGLIRNCKHFIIANSSFSWWGAWLSDNQGKIICAPARWFRNDDEGNIVPGSWTRIEG